MRLTFRVAIDEWIRSQVFSANLSHPLEERGVCIPKLPKPKQVAVAAKSVMILAAASHGV